MKKKTSKKETTLVEWAKYFMCVPNNPIFIANSVRTGSTVAFSRIRKLGLDKELAYHPDWQKQFETLARNEAKSPAAMKWIGKLGLDKELAYDPARQYAFETLASRVAKSPAAMEMIGKLGFAVKLAYDSAWQEQFETLASRVAKSPAAMEMIGKLGLDKELAYHPTWCKRDWQKQFNTLAERVAKSPAAMERIGKLGLDKELAYDPDWEEQFNILSEISQENMKLIEPFLLENPSVDRSSLYTDKNYATRLVDNLRQLPPTKDVANSGPAEKGRLSGRKSAAIS